MPYTIYPKQQGFFLVAHLDSTNLEKNMKNPPHKYIPMTVPWDNALVFTDP